MRVGVCMWVVWVGAPGEGGKGMRWRHCWRKIGNEMSSRHSQTKSTSAEKMLEKVESLYPSIRQQSLYNLTLVPGNHEALGWLCILRLYIMPLHGSHRSPTPSCVVSATTRNGFWADTHVFCLWEVWNLRSSRKALNIYFDSSSCPQPVN